MNATMTRLVYVSRNAVGTDTPEADEALERLLSASRVENASNGVAGLLMYDARCFAGLLEGERGTVLRTFERLREDPIHSQVVLVTVEPIAVRSFTAWSMLRLENGAELLGPFLAERQARLAAATPEELVRMPCGWLQREHLLEMVEHLAFGATLDEARMAA